MDQEIKHRIMQLDIMSAQLVMQQLTDSTVKNRCKNLVV